MEIFKYDGGIWLQRPRYVAHVPTPQLYQAASSFVLHRETIETEYLQLVQVIDGEDGVRYGLYRPVTAAQHAQWWVKYRIRMRLGTYRRVPLPE